MLAYTYEQGAQPGDKLGRQPPAIWLVFLADGARRSRFFRAYDNRGEITERRTSELRYFDLHESDLLQALQGRLVIEWTKDTINWAKPGTAAASLSIVEIADPETIPFPGFDSVRIPYETVRLVVDDSRYWHWRTALAAVKGIYLITDTTDGRLYVGKADGRDGIFGRWTTYAHDGHGGNLALRELAKVNPAHAGHYQFSILRVFAPNTLQSEVDAAEAHYKRALLSVEFGLNKT